ncbi:MAG TPA: PDZ domain-containing protein [Thermoanaerobaculia bacterium]|nr:PDZ domain-containing protein [Thermoanaerobaculia bacterium]
MRTIFCTLCVVGCAALLLTPLVVSARGSEGPAVIELTDDGQTAAPGYLGVEVVELTEQLRLRFGVPEGRGVLVAEVAAGSAAERAGILAGDVLVSLGGEPVSETWGLRGAVSRHDAGEPVPLVVVRDRALVELSATLDGRPSRRAARQRAGQRWERSDRDWERFGERMEHLGERMEHLGERLGERFERLGEDLGQRMEERAERWERSGEDWERFGAEMERFGEEWERFGEELGRSFEDVDWEAMSHEIAAAVREAMESVDWEQLGSSIREAVGQLDVHLEGPRE